ncbi:hypothetical protein KXR87_23120, partial [Yokenella regensburgei]|uniref:hypothetical protein n=2 Tax=Yokenella regensburgei TaxID=158877 RepID=UPI003F16546C
RQAVDHRAPVGVGRHRQVVRFVIQVLAVQGTAVLLCQHPGLRPALPLVKPGGAGPADFLAAQVVFNGQRGVVCYLPRFQLPRQTTAEMLRDTGSGALCDIILLRIVTVRSPPAVEGFRPARLPVTHKDPACTLRATGWLRRVLTPGAA